MPDAQLPAYLLAGWRAVQANFRAGLFLQLAFLLLIASYFVLPEARGWIDQAGRFKEATGLPFVLVSSVLAGALFPEILKVILQQSGRITLANVRRLIFLIPLWIFLGTAIELLYQAQQFYFGSGHSFRTVTLKVMVDRFVYTPLFGIPAPAALFEFRRAGISVAKVRYVLGLEFYRNRVVPLLFAAWAIWLPIVSIIYLMPGSLQFPLFVVALSFWSIIQTAIAE